MASARLVALALLVAASPVAPARAQVYVHPQQIRGIVTFSNVDPAIRAEIDRLSTRGAFSWRLVATSTAADLESTRQATTPTRTQLPYEMTVEASTTGCEYRVGVEVYDGHDHSPWGVSSRSRGPSWSTQSPLPTPSSTSRSARRSCVSPSRTPWDGPFR